MAAVAPASGWLSDRVGAALPATTGMALLAAGALLLTRLGPDTEPARPRLGTRPGGCRSRPLPVSQQQRPDGVRPARPPGRRGGRPRHRPQPRQCARHRHRRGCLSTASWPATPPPAPSSPPSTPACGPSPLPPSWAPPPPPSAPASARHLADRRGRACPYPPPRPHPVLAFSVRRTLPCRGFLHPRHPPAASPRPGPRKRAGPSPAPTPPYSPALPPQNWGRGASSLRDLPPAQHHRRHHLRRERRQPHREARLGGLKQILRQRAGAAGLAPQPALRVVQSARTISARRTRSDV